MAWLLFGMGGLCLLVFLYPYIIYPLVLMLLPRKPLKAPDSNAQPLRASLLFCAYNEQGCLDEKIENLRELKQAIPDLEILAYSDGSTDGTNEMLLAASDILQPMISRGRSGKVVGMRRLVQRATTEVLVFCDANVIIDPDSMKRLIAYFQDPQVGAVAGKLIYKHQGQKLSDTARVGGLYWKLEEFIKRLESRSGSTMGADGSLFARRRAGYPQLGAELVDDLAVSISVLFDGLRCVSAADVYAYENLVTDRRDEFNRKRRIACGAMATYQFLAPRIKTLGFIDRLKFFSHKTIRWWGGVELGLATLLFLGGSWMAGFGAIALVALILGVLALTILGGLGLPVFGQLLEIVRAILGTNMGILEHYFGKKYATWTPAKSR